MRLVRVGYIAAAGVFLVHRPHKTSGVRIAGATMRRASPASKSTDVQYHHVPDYTAHVHQCCPGNRSPAQVDWACCLFLSRRTRSPSSGA